MRALLYALAGLCAAPLIAQDTAPANLAPEKRTFVRPKVPAALFTQEKTALLDIECERLATFLARYAAEKYTAAILRNDTGAMTQGRLLLTISLHLVPLNASAVHCADRWLEGSAPSLPPPGEDLRVLSGFLLTAALRQAGAPGTCRDVLSRILIRLAADLDPENEDAIYTCELQDRDGKAPPLRELLEGTLTVE